MVSRQESWEVKGLWTLLKANLTLGKLKTVT